MTKNRTPASGDGGALNNSGSRKTSAHKLPQQQRQAAKLTHKQLAALGSLTKRPVTLPRVAFLERPEIDGGATRVRLLSSHRIGSPSTTVRPALNTPFGAARPVLKPSTSTTSRLACSQR